MFYLERGVVCVHFLILTKTSVVIDSLLLTADIISTVEFNYSGDLLATGDKGGRVVIFQREQEVSALQSTNQMALLYSA